MATTVSAYAAASSRSAEPAARKFKRRHMLKIQTRRCVRQSTLMHLRQRTACRYDKCDA